MSRDREYGAKRDAWRPANLLPCRLACRITLRRLFKLIGDADPYPTRDIDPDEIEMWSEGADSAFVRRRKMLARSTRSMQHGLSSGHIRASCLNDGKFVPIPMWAWIRDDRVHYVWGQNRILFDALLPDRWAHLSRSPVFVDRNTFAAWLAQQLPTLPVESLDQICTEERPPAPVKSRLPTDRPYIPLGEALSWLGFGVALQADDLYELLETGEIGDGVEWARDRITKAMERLADAALAERVRCIGKHRTYSLFEETPLTEPIPPIKFADYRRYDPVYDGIFYGAGLHNMGEESLMDGALSSGRTDHFASVQVHRGDLLAFFGKARAEPTRAIRPPVAKPRVGDGTLLAWFESLEDDVRHSGQELLLERARQHFHFNRVTRDQIRELTEGRKRGPKPIAR